MVMSKDKCTIVRETARFCAQMCLVAESSHESGPSLNGCLLEDGSRISYRFAVLRAQLFLRGCRTLFCLLQSVAVIR